MRTSIDVALTNTNDAITAPSATCTNSAAVVTVASVVSDGEADDTARAAVLYGAGGTFCAGADLKAIGNDGSESVVTPYVYPARQKTEIETVQ